MVKRTLWFLSFLCAGSAGAGEKKAETVWISNFIITFARGDVAAVRASGNAIEYIGCTVTTMASGSSGECFARNAAGTTVSCSFDDADLIAAARSIGPDSHIHFSFDGSGDCQLIQVTRGSWYAPKVP